MSYRYINFADNGCGSIQIFFFADFFQHLFFDLDGGIDQDEGRENLLAVEAEQGSKKRD
jgi:hypothetical protein